MLYIYIGCLTFGIVYSIISAIFGADHGGVEHGGVHIDGGVHDSDMPSPFSPLVIACAIATFGGIGTIGKVGFGMGELASFVSALSFAGVVGAVVFFGIVRFMYGSQSNSAYSEAELEGIEAEVVTPIPAWGVGEIAYVINGVRYSLPARSEDGMQITKASRVRIVSVKNHTAHVIKKVTIDDICSSEIDGLNTEKKQSNNNKFKGGQL